jgi:predicted methyltransferase
MNVFPRSCIRNASLLAATFFALGLAACGSINLKDEPDSSARLQAVVDDPVRTERDRGMDEDRHPLEFLQFTQVRPGMRVLDVSAGAGYTSQLLALAVGPSGNVWAQTPKPGAALTERLAAHPQSNLILAKRPFDDPVPPEAAPLDLVTLVLNYHDISYLPVDRDAMNRKLFAALRPGGRYVIVDHSAQPGTGIAAGKTLHRIDEAFVIAEVQRAGFVLDREASFMRNAADRRDEHSGRMKEPSDKFVLRFVKPQ